MVMEMYRKMVMSLMPDNLKKQLSAEKGEIGEGIKYYLLAALVVDVIFLISIGLQMLLVGASATTEGASAEALAAIYGLSAVWIVALLILIPVLMVVMPLITTGLGYIVCKILGGKGTYANQFYHFAVVSSGLAVVTSLVGLVPCLGSLANLALSVYYLYPTFLIYRSVHKLSDGRAAIVTILPIIFLILALVLLFVLYASMMAALLGAMGGTTVPYS